MRLKTRVSLIVLVSLIGLMAVGFAGLQTMRTNLNEERRAQIAHMLDFAESLAGHFYALETSGKLTREEAQARAIEAIAAQKSASSYYFIRNLTDDFFVFHPNPAKLGKPDDGGTIPDGRSAAQAYREELAKSSSNKAFLYLPGQKSNNTLPKINGVVRIDPWGWMIGTGFYVKDIEDRFWNLSFYFALGGSVLIGALALLVFRLRSSILRQLGGDPEDAVETMRRIANGDISMDIPVSQTDQTSMMASLKLMQMKLSNLANAIQDNTDLLNKQVKRFEDSAQQYVDSKSSDCLDAMTGAASRIGRTADVLYRSVARFKL